MRRATMAMAALLFATPQVRAETADAIAERFARESERAEAARSSAARKAAQKKKLEAEKKAAKADEAARKEEEARKAAEQQKAAEVQKAQSAKKAAEAKKAKEAEVEREINRLAEARKAREAARRASAARRADEDDMLQRARREQEERRAAAKDAAIAEEARELIERAERERRKAETLLGNGEQAPPAATAKTETRTQEPTQPAAAENHPVATAAKATETVPASPPAAERTEPSTPIVVRIDPPAVADTAERDRKTIGTQDAMARARAEEIRKLTEKLRHARQEREARASAPAREGNAKKDETRPDGEAVAGLPAGGNAPTPVVESPVPPSAATADARKPEAVAVAPPAPQPPPPAPERKTETVTATPPPQPEPPAPIVTADPRKDLEPPSALGRPVTATNEKLMPRTEQTATVLVVLTPGTYGIRRGAKTADPILCTQEGCYVSVGNGVPARFLPGRKALGFGNTWGLRAGACRNSLGCVFRGIALADTPTQLQPIDLHILRHDPRPVNLVTADTTCRTDAGRLVCGNPIAAGTYTMWVVPESIAEAAGPDVLQRAVREGLAGPRSAEISTFAGGVAHGTR